MKENVECIVSKCVVIEGYKHIPEFDNSFASPEEALVIYSPETGRIEDIVVKSQCGNEEFIKKKKELVASKIVVRDYSGNVIMPGNDDL